MKFRMPTHPPKQNRVAKEKKRIEISYAYLPLKQNGEAKEIKEIEISYAYSSAF